MSSSEISDKNVGMASFDDVPEEVCKAFEERKKAREEKEMQELLPCYVKDHRGSFTQIKEHVLPLIDYTKEVYAAIVSHPSTSVTPRMTLLCFFKHVKLTRNMVGDEVAKGLAKFSQDSKYQPTTFAATHPTAPSPSATPSTSMTQPSYGMLLNYFSGQTPPTHKTAKTLHTPEPIPISSIPLTLAIPGQASIVPPLAPTGADNNTITGVGYAAPHAPPTGHLNETTSRIWEGVERQNKP
jgi:hypothetical protein